MYVRAVPGLRSCRERCQRAFWLPGTLDMADAGLPRSPRACVQVDRYIFASHKNLLPHACSASSSDSDGESKAAVDVRAAAMASTRQALATLKAAVVHRAPATTAGGGARAEAAGTKGSTTDAARPALPSANSGTDAAASSRAAEASGSGGAEEVDDGAASGSTDSEDGNKTDDGLGRGHAPSDGPEPGDAAPAVAVDVHALATALEQQLQDLEAQVCRGWLSPAFLVCVCVCVYGH